MTVEVPAHDLALVIHELLRRGVPNAVGDSYDCRANDVRAAVIRLSCKLQLHEDARIAALPDLSDLPATTPKES